MSVTPIRPDALTAPAWLNGRVLELFNAIQRECQLAGVELTAINQLPAVAFAILLESIEQQKAAILTGAGGPEVVELFDSLVLVSASAEEFMLSRRTLSTLLLMPQGIQAYTAERLAEIQATKERDA